MIPFEKKPRDVNEKRAAPATSPVWTAQRPQACGSWSSYQCPHRHRDTTLATNVDDQMEKNGKSVYKSSHRLAPDTLQGG